jgi:hypothetical protein
MNPIPRILQAEPGITEADRQTLEKVSRLLDLLDSAVDFSVLAKQDWYRAGTMSPRITIGVLQIQMANAVTLYNSLS